MRTHVLVIDNHDSFTWNAVHALRMAGAETTVVRSFAPEVARDATHLVLSPGPGAPEAATDSINALNHFAGNRPVLGICLGHQILARESGSPVRRLPNPVHGKTSTIGTTGRHLFARLPRRFPVARYHSLFVSRADVGTAWDVDAWCESDPEIVMAVSAPDRRVYGVQFHPESFLTEWGDELLRAFLAV